MKSKVYSGLAVILGMTVNAQAAGFRIGEQDARANAMGNAFVAVADNAAAAWYNPAATVDLEGKNNVSAGLVLIVPRMEHYSETQRHSDLIKPKGNIAPHMYAVTKLNDRTALSLSVNAPYGMASVWDKESYTSEYSVKSEVKDINYGLNLAYKLSEKFSVAAGVDYASIDAYLTKMYGPYELKISGDGYGLGYNAAAMYHYNDKWDFGASYRSSITSTLRGNARVVSKTAIKADLTLPDTFQIGAAYRLNEKWRFTVVGDYTNWSTYDEIVFKNRSDGTTYGSEVKDWNDAWAVRLASEYVINDRWKVRGGAFYDWTPVPESHFETRVPDNDRLSFSIGFGYAHKDLSLDFSYCHVRFFDRSIGGGTDLSGKYYATASLPAVTLGYKF